VYLQAVIIFVKSAAKKGDSPVQYNDKTVVDNKQKNNVEFGLSDKIIRKILRNPLLYGII
jgi:hypothetical protein